MTIAVVTAWLNHRDLLPDYMAAIDAGNPEELHVIDNGSDPPLPFAQIRFDTNRGFSAASNAGLAAADADAVVFLNNDIVLTSPDWLDRIRLNLEPGVLVGARVRYADHADVDGRQYPYLDGWCLAGMRDDLLELAGFDEGYDEPAYFSDNDLCFRARVAGMRLRQVTVGLRHLENVTARDDAAAVQRAHAANYVRYATLVRSKLPVAA